MTKIVNIGRPRKPKRRKGAVTVDYDECSICPGHEPTTEEVAIVRGWLADRWMTAEEAFDLADDIGNIGYRVSEMARERDGTTMPHLDAILNCLEVLKLIEGQEAA